MCGFAGFIDAPERPVREGLMSTVERMADCLRHRGPDDGGAWADESAGVALGFRRLAVVELSAAGHQPFVSKDGRLVLAFNGEIYNHLALRQELSAFTSVEWSGHSDTETLINCFAVWGVANTLKKTVGMFALAVWDRAERRLFLARDRFGEKPLYYGWSQRAFVFGSELKALRRYPGFDNSIDRNVLASYMQFAYVPAPYSIYANVYKLEPGCLLSMTVDDAATPPSTALFAPVTHERLTIERYWCLTEAIEYGAERQLADDAEAITLVESALSDAVQRQSIADVPLGAFLSGGIDSSTIVALMQAQSGRKVKTFTIGFDEAGFNEAEHAKAVARHLGTDHTELYVSAQQARDVIPQLPDLYSEPFADSSQIPTHLVSQIARRHVTVSLSGDGGDELFGGYSRYLWGPRLWNRLQWLPPVLRRGVAAAIHGIPTSTWDAIGTAAPGPIRIAHLGDKAHKLAYRLTHATSIDALYRILVTIWPPECGVVLGAHAAHSLLDTTMQAFGSLRPEERMMGWDALTYLPDDILHKVDRASMGVSLETRAPFLDHHVAELAWRLPIGMKIRNGETKWIIRQVLYRYVPRTLIERPKMGFGVPVDAWLRGPLRAWAEDLLNERALREQGYLDAGVIRQKWAEHLSGKRNWHMELWSALMFQAWLPSQH